MRHDMTERGIALADIEIEMAKVQLERSKVRLEREKVALEHERDVLNNGVTITITDEEPGLELDDEYSFRPGTEGAAQATMAVCEVRRAVGAIELANEALRSANVIGFLSEYSARRFKKTDFYITAAISDLTFVGDLIERELKRAMKGEKL